MSDGAVLLLVLILQEMLFIDLLLQEGIVLGLEMREEFGDQLPSIQLGVLFKDPFHEFVVKVVRVHGRALQRVALEPLRGQ
jgi:hypothetical protein